MSTSNPFALIISAASDPTVGVDRLVRAALLVASASGDATMTEWCNSELKGYADRRLDELPEYRKVGARLMATDHYGRNVPAVIRDPEAAKVLGMCPMPMPLGDLMGFLQAERGAEFQMFFTPDFAAKLKANFSGVSDIFRLVQKLAIDSMVEAIRQHVFAWAMPNAGTSLQLPEGLSLEMILGVSLAATARAVSPPIQAIEGPGVSLTISGLTNSAVMVNSPGATTSVVQHNTTDVAALQGLVAAMADAIDKATKSGVERSAIAAIEAPLDELVALSRMASPKWEWVRQAAGSVKVILEQAAGSVLGNLATPQVTTLLAQLLKG